ncbi:MAG TPA: protein-methionine-sulfoxide reductase heme-binding subunit MsrQ [Gemmatimonadales bacterium]|nr:protein-methionine-sulfoxide reductase heme-binding subunit MsrQ [Gemmatimonadales bacterium]
MIRAVRPLLYVASTLPGAWVVFALATGRVDGDQVKFIQHVTGTTVLVSLFITLSITPVRRLTGWNPIIRTRRLIGLTAFWYSVLHFLTYVVFDQALSPADIADDVAKHPWVLVGFTSFLLLIPLAVTSTDGWVRRLGGRRWQRLHRLVYPAAVGGVLHFLWLVKKDVRTPLYFAGALAILFGARVWVAWGRRTVRVRRTEAVAPRLRSAGEDAA